MDFISNQWIMRKYTEINISKCVVKEYITQAQADEIMAMAQVEVITS